MDSESQLRHDFLFLFSSGIQVINEIQKFIANSELGDLPLSIESSTNPILLPSMRLHSVEGYVHRASTTPYLASHSNAQIKSYNPDP